MHYRYKTGMLAWVLFRITGLALVGYLSMHLFVVSSLNNPSTFNKTMGFLGSWQFRVLELGLLAVVLYHSLNGVRIFIVDFFNGSRYQARLFWSLMVVGVILFALGAYPMVSHALYWKNKPAHIELKGTELGATSILACREGTVGDACPTANMGTGGDASPTVKEVRND